MSAFTSRVSAVSQLLVSWYFDEKLFELEQKLLFEAGPGYVGHALMLPEKGNCRSREWLDHARLLHRGAHQLSSICRQRQAIRLEGSGSSAHICQPLAALDLPHGGRAHRRALMKAGRNEHGPWLSPFEDGMAHFHRFYRNLVEAHW